VSISRTANWNADQGTFDYYGPLNKLALNIGSHKEHHDLHEIPWTCLPELNTIAGGFYDMRHCQRSWVALFATFVFYPSYSLGTRLENVTQAAECATPPAPAE
jgi:sphingolipid delta-4 desaturase